MADYDGSDTETATLGHGLVMRLPGIAHRNLTPSCDGAILGAGDMFRSFQSVAAFKRPIQRRRHISYFDGSDAKTATLEHVVKLHLKQKIKAGVMPQPERVP